MKESDQKVYRRILGMALACGSMAPGAVVGQTNNTPSATNVLSTVTVEGQLNEARTSILTAIGASAYSISSEAILNEAQGNNASFNQVLLRAPGVAEDSLGQVHVRGEHANLQYRINDVLLPEGITGFGSELDPRFVKDMQLITGSLPAEYGLRTAGIVDIQTKSGAALNGGSAEVFTGSYDTIRPSFEYGISTGKSSFFIDGSYDHNDIGIENPAPTSVPIHDYTDQYKSFMYYSYIMDPTSRIIVMGSLSYSQFQIPINPNQKATPQPGTATPWLGATEPSVLSLNDNQNEQNYYGVVAYQKSSGDLNYQVSAYARNSSAHYVPGNIPATLDYNSGVATDEDRVLYSGGGQLDLSYTVGDSHTLRGGLLYLHEAVTADTTTTVFGVNGAGVATNGPVVIPQDNGPHADFGGMYLQDEWKILPQLTLNAGGRFDVYTSDSDSENQVSPRANLVYKPWESTTLHGGYARYFTPPPLETVPAANISTFENTTGQSGAPGPYNVVRAERANYYDLGVSQKVLPGLTLGVDGYYKTAQEQLDDGFFGQSLILSSFNYTEGRVRGIEFTANYDKGGFSSYANVAYSVAQGRGAASAQFLWADQTVVNYINHNWIYLDHDQRVTGSFGTAYTWNEPGRWSTKVFADALYGSGLRQDGSIIPGVNPNGDSIPNGSSVGQYYSLNFGVSERLRLTGKQSLIARLDIVNITDNIYALRTGTGVGVNAAQYGERRGFFGSLSYLF